MAILGREMAMNEFHVALTLFIAIIGRLGAAFALGG